MARYVFGIDLGGTTVKIGLLTEGGEKVEFWEIPTRTENNGANILFCILKILNIFHIHFLLCPLYQK